MDSFLRQVAAHYSKEDVSRLCFIFPSRRALAFFKKILPEELLKSGALGRPVFAPRMVTVNDFFYRIAQRQAADRVTLLVELYESYRKFYNVPGREPETLDEFIFWGDMILGDFNDVDKYLVNAESLFTNVADLKSIQDDYSYLAPEQIEAINKFISNFRRDGRLTVDMSSDKPGVKARFLHIWDKLLDIYKDFNTRLDSLGLAYEGQVYRRIAARFKEESAVDILKVPFTDTDRFIFVGLNALNECERSVMGRMRDAGLADFCWDYSSEWIKDRKNRSSFFMQDNISRFKNAFEPSASPVIPDFNIVSIASGIGQAKQIPQILERVGGHGIETAIILPDESLLTPVLNTIPESIRELNVTMGFPMKSSGIYALMNSVAALQLHIRVRQGVLYFYHKQVHDIISNGVIQAVMDESDKRAVEQILKVPCYYVAADSLKGTPLLDAIFQPVTTDLTEASAQTIHRFEEYMLNVISAIAPGLKACGQMSSELEFAKEYHLALARLRRHDLPILPATFFSLLIQMVGTISVPFHGEPLKGLQIMGPLETRALDFDNLIILSCCEGVFPRKSVSASFIPHELRKGFGLPTYEHQDAMWAYYFYRMIQRARNVWMLCDTRPDAGKGGEESRFIKQIEKYYGAQVRRYIATAPIDNLDSDMPVEKTAEHIEKLRRKGMSASSMKNYLDCPMKFYYSAVERLKEEDEVSESLDSRTVGNVFHHVMEAFYKGRPDNHISEAYLRELLGNSASLEEEIERQICLELNCFEVEGKNLIYARVVKRMIKDTLETDLKLLEEAGLPFFTILSIEEPEGIDICGFNFTAYLDRKDTFEPGVIRVVDYKTGKVMDKEKRITDANAKEVVDALFGEKSEDRPKIALQMYIYDKVAEADNPGAQIINVVYSATELASNGVNKEPVSKEFLSLMDRELTRTLNEIADLTIPFTRTSDLKACEHCDFKNICGR